MSTSVGSFKIGRVLRTTGLGILGLAMIVGSAYAQQNGSRETLRTPQEKSFLNPGPVSSERRAPGYVVDGLISSPAYGPASQFNHGLLPPVIGGGDAMIGNGR